MSSKQGCGVIQRYFSWCRSRIFKNKGDRVRYFPAEATVLVPNTHTNTLVNKWLVIQGKKFSSQINIRNWTNDFHSYLNVTYIRCPKILLKLFSGHLYALNIEHAMDRGHMGNMASTGKLATLSAFPLNL